MSTSKNHRHSTPCLRFIKTNNKKSPSVLVAEASSDDHPISLRSSSISPSSSKIQIMEQQSTTTACSSRLKTLSRSSKQSKRLITNTNRHDWILRKIKKNALFQKVYPPLKYKSEQQQQQQQQHQQQTITSKNTIVNHENDEEYASFLHSFSVPVQLYKYLAHHQKLQPSFLQRNLLYIQRLRTPSCAKFKKKKLSLTDIVERLHQQANQQTNNKIHSIICSPYVSQWLETMQHSIDFVEIQIARIFHKNAQFIDKCFLRASLNYYWEDCRKEKQGYFHHWLVDNNNPFAIEACDLDNVHYNIHGMAFPISLHKDILQPIISSQIQRIKSIELTFHITIAIYSPNNSMSTISSPITRNQNVANNKCSTPTTSNKKRRFSRRLSQQQSGANPTKRVLRQFTAQIPFITINDDGVAEMILTAGDYHLNLLPVINTAIPIEVMNLVTNCATSSFLSQRQQQQQRRSSSSSCLSPNFIALTPSSSKSPSRQHCLHPIQELDNNNCLTAFQSAAFHFSVNVHHFSNKKEMSATPKRSPTKRKMETMTTTIRERSPRKTRQSGGGGGGDDCHLEEKKSTVTVNNNNDNKKKSSSGNRCFSNLLVMPFHIVYRFYHHQQLQQWTVSYSLECPFCHINLAKRSHFHKSKDFYNSNDNNNSSASSAFHRPLQRSISATVHVKAPPQRSHSTCSLVSMTDTMIPSSSTSSASSSVQQSAVYCRQLLESLVIHLRTSHPRFLFHVNYVSDAVLRSVLLSQRKSQPMLHVDIHINHDYDGSLDLGSTPSHNQLKVFSLSENRLPFTHWIHWKEWTSTAIALAQPEDPGIAWQSIPVGHTRQYYHTWSTLPIPPCELLTENSLPEMDEGEFAADWIQHYYFRNIQEFLDVNEEEKKIMHLWSVFLLKERFTGHCLVMDVCQRFIKTHAHCIKDYRANLLLHFTNMVDYGLLSPQDLLKLMIHFDELNNFKQLE